MSVAAAQWQRHPGSFLDSELSYEGSQSPAGARSWWITCLLTLAHTFLHAHTPPHLTHVMHAFTVMEGNTYICNKVWLQSCSVTFRLLLVEKLVSLLQCWIFPLQFLTIELSFDSDGLTPKSVTASFWWLMDLLLWTSTAAALKVSQLDIILSSFFTVYVIYSMLFPFIIFSSAPKTPTSVVAAAPSMTLTVPHNTI